MSATGDDLRDVVLGILVNSLKRHKEVDGDISHGGKIVFENSECHEGVSRFFAYQETISHLE